jgi:hypothetical protein
MLLHTVSVLFGCNVLVGRGGLHVGPVTMSGGTSQLTMIGKKMCAPAQGCG